MIGFKILTIDKITKEQFLLNATIPDKQAAIEFARHMDAVEPECEHIVVEDDYIVDIENENLILTKTKISV